MRVPPAAGSGQQAALGKEPEDEAPGTATPPTWASGDRERAYRELEHPADLLLEITGPSLAGLLENALFAFYDQVADLGGFKPNRELLITVRENSASDVLRTLLSEALYRFETEGFVAAGGEVTVDTETPPKNLGPLDGRAASEERGIEIVARLWGENATPGRHTLATEIKGVTYHRLALERRPDGTYVATVLFDI